MCYYLLLEKDPPGRVVGIVGFDDDVVAGLEVVVLAKLRVGGCSDGDEEGGRVTGVGEVFGDVFEGAGVWLVVDPVDEPPGELAVKVAVSGQRGIDAVDSVLTKPEIPSDFTTILYQFAIDNGL